MAGKHFYTVFLVALFLCTSLATAAPFVYTSQTRSVFAHTHGPGGDPTQSFSASNFALFDQTAAVADSSGFGNASQRQRSELLADTISILSSFSGVRPAFAGTGIADGQSTAIIAFTVAGATNVRLDANVGWTENLVLPQGPRTVSLIGPGANIDWRIYNYPPDPWLGPRSVNLTLTPGSYTLTVDLDSWIGGFQPAFSTAGGTVTLTQVPEPAALAATSLLTTALIVRRRNRPTQ
jgi:hypothetical protein